MRVFTTVLVTGSLVVTVFGGLVLAQDVAVDGRLLVVEEATTMDAIPAATFCSSVWQPNISSSVR